jgi:hypothetical protein
MGLASKKKKNHKKGLTEWLKRYACLPSMREALSSNPHQKKEKKKV